jgi:4-hydroxy-tetrahydrodipicolinate reductase
MKIVVCGSNGRMGRLIVSLAGQYGCEVVGEISRESDFAAELGKVPDLCVDFTSPDGLLALCGVAAERGVKIVSGTTGLGDGHRRELASVAKNIPILHATNFSIGIFVLNKLLKVAAESLPESFDIEIVERHHSKKKDAPSGTAMTLLKNIQSARHCAEIFGRRGNCERSAGELCLHSVRGGDIVGDHEILFAGQGERLELIHRATNREIFARGALYAAQKFAEFNQPGFYTLDDVL